MTPDANFRIDRDSALDDLAIGNFIVEGSVDSAATWKKWEGKSKWRRARHLLTAQ